MAGDREVDVFVHQPWLVKRDDAVAVGDVSHLVAGAQLDERNAALRLLVHDCDLEVVVRACAAAREKHHEDRRGVDAGGKCASRRPG